MWHLNLGPGFSRWPNYYLAARDGRAVVKATLSLPWNGEKDEQNMAVYAPLTPEDIALVEGHALLCLGRLATVGLTGGASAPVPLPARPFNYLAWRHARRPPNVFPALPTPADLGGWARFAFDMHYPNILEAKAVRESDGVRASIWVNVLPEPAYARTMLHGPAYPPLIEEGMTPDEPPVLWPEAGRGREAWRPGDTDSNSTLPHSGLLVRVGRFVVSVRLHVPEGQEDAHRFTVDDRRFVDEQAALCLSRLEAMGVQPVLEFSGAV